MQAVQGLTSRQFDRIAALARDRWGLHLTLNKVQLVTSRLSAYVRRSTFPDIAAYLEHLEHDATDRDLLEFFDLLSTNVTSFFRDRAHFDYLERELLTGIARGTITLPNKRLRLWSAGCSIGCEPYTMAMVVHDTLRESRGWDVKILATDLSNYAVGAARDGLYDADAVEGLSKDTLDRHFERRADAWSVRPHLRAMVQIGQLNLMEKWPMHGPFDVIFCRNVMIYFDADTRERLVRRFIDLLRPGGILAVGSAETLAGMNVGLRAAMPSLYVK